MPYKNIEKALNTWFLRNQVFCLKIENFDEFQLSYSSMFFAETWHTFSTDHYLKKCVCGFFILFRS